MSQTEKPTVINLGTVLKPLNKLLAANERLSLAIQGTQAQWPYVTNCWIDQMSEPTKDLANHRLHENAENGGG